MPPGCDLILIPGFCEGELDEIEHACGVPAERGPKDLIDIPAYFSVERKREDYGAYSIQIIAEIQDALELSEEALLDRAAYYRASGANVIDLGIGPASSGGHGISHGETAQRDWLPGQRGQHGPGHHPSKRTEAGADYILSLNASNLALGRDLQATAVVIPDDDGDVQTLWRNAEQLWEWGIDVYS